MQNSYIPIVCDNQFHINGSHACILCIVLAASKMLNQQSRFPRTHGTIC